MHFISADEMRHREPKSAPRSAARCGRRPAAFAIRYARPWLRRGKCGPKWGHHAAGTRPLKILLSSADHCGRENQPRRLWLPLGDQRRRVIFGRGDAQRRGAPGIYHHPPARRIFVLDRAEIQINNVLVPGPPVKGQRHPGHHHRARQHHRRPNSQPDRRQGRTAR